MLAVGRTQLSGVMTLFHARVAHPNQRIRTSIDPWSSSPCAAVSSSVADGMANEESREASAWDSTRRSEPADYRVVAGSPVIVMSECRPSKTLQLVTDATIMTRLNIWLQRDARACRRRPSQEKVCVDNSDNEHGNLPQPPDDSANDQLPGFLSDDTTVELIVKAKKGDEIALGALIERALPALTRWAHGRLPGSARGRMDTSDLVQEAVMNAVRHIGAFEPRGVGAMQAYLRQSVMNRIRDEIRFVGRRGVSEELEDNVSSSDPSPLEQAITTETYERYREAVAALERRRDRQLVIARFDLQWTSQEVADYFQFRTVAAARMATNRAVEKLAALLKRN